MYRFTDHEDNNLPLEWKILSYFNVVQLLNRYLMFPTFLSYETSSLYIVLYIASQREIWFYFNVVLLFNCIGYLPAEVDITFPTIL